MAKGYWVASALAVVLLGAVGLNLSQCTSCVTSEPERIALRDQARRLSTNLQSLADLGPGSGTGIWGEMDGQCQGAIKRTAASNWPDTVLIARLRECGRLFKLRMKPVPHTNDSEQVGAALHDRIDGQRLANALALQSFALDETGDLLQSRQVYYEGMELLAHASLATAPLDSAVDESSPAVNQFPTPTVAQQVDLLKQHCYEEITPRGQAVRVFLREAAVALLWPSAERHNLNFLEIAPEAQRRVDPHKGFSIVGEPKNFTFSYTDLAGRGEEGVLDADKDTYRISLKT